MVINGHGELNTYDGDGAAEGIADPSGQGRDVFGAADLDGNGTNEFFDSAESSGTLRYVSIRHGGSEMPNPPVNFANVINGDETNGLSLNGVGSGTTIEHVEIVSTLDDGLQIMGGSVNLKHIAVAFSSEENLESLSFLPYTNPQIANFTSIGHSELTAVRGTMGAVDASTTASSRTGASALTSRTTTLAMRMSFSCPGN